MIFKQQKHEIIKFWSENVVKHDIAFGSDKKKQKIEIKENSKAWNVSSKVMERKKRNSSRNKQKYCCI